MFDSLWIWAFRWQNQLKNEPGMILELVKSLVLTDFLSCMSQNKIIWLLAN